MNAIEHRLNALRQEMHRLGVDAWYISGTDPHASEYLSERWKIREFISGFTGSWGTVVITQQEACLWTDSRYFLQADEQLKGSEFKMYKLRVPDALEPDTWLTQRLKPGSKVGFDSQTLTVAGFRNLNASLKNSGISLVEAPDVFEKIWEDRPALSEAGIFELEPCFTGLSREEKLKLAGEILKDQKADNIVINALDELAWIFNLRGADIPYNPVFIGYAIVGTDERMLFVHKKKIPSALKARLVKENIKLKEYTEFFTFLKTLRGRIIWIDPSTASYAMFSSLRSENVITEKRSAIALLKSRKNEAEQEGFRQAMKKDGVALIEFLFWLRENVKKGTADEYLAGRKLAGLRSMQKDFLGESFAPIFGYKHHGAMVHLSVGPGNALPLEPEGILLFDSGGHYLQGTTDITRTIALGAVSLQQKTDFTLVLKGMISLTRAKFPRGTKGCNLDVLARQALWANGLNYGHGTGHGVGHCLFVHEGPVSIRQELNEVPIEPGMVISNEPGIYREGEYGIRTENILLCVEKERTPFGNFLGFETLTLCPIDTKLIEPSLLTREEKEWLNSYHARVNKELSPLLRKELAEFLIELTLSIE
jgi:Xaa-Pro aminopeptidase